MNIQFYSKNVDLTNQIKDYVQEKIGGLERFEANIIECRIDLSQNTHHQKGDIYRVEVNIKLAYDKKLVRAVEKAETLMAGIDKVKDKLKRQITEVKDKLKNH